MTRRATIIGALLAIALAACTSSSSSSNRPAIEPVVRKPIYCFAYAANACMCGPNEGGDMQMACSVPSVGGGVCCAESGFVTAGNGVCACAAPACTGTFSTPFGDTCMCNMQPSSTAIACPPAPGQTCCLRSAVECFCSMTPEPCAQDGGIVVATCTAAMLSPTCATAFPSYSQTLTDCMKNQ